MSAPLIPVVYHVNGHRHATTVRPGDRLLRVLRGLGEHSVKYGCDTGECGACTILVDGAPILACLYPAVRADGHELTTVTALGHTDGLDPLQTSFLAHGAVQCGYCTPGMLLAARALLAHETAPDAAAIRTALAGVLCRCTGYVKPVEAITATVATREERQPERPETQPARRRVG